MSEQIAVIHVLYSHRVLVILMPSFHIWMSEREQKKNVSRTYYFIERSITFRADSSDAAVLHVYHCYYYLGPDATCIRYTPPAAAVQLFVFQRLDMHIALKR